MNKECYCPVCQKSTEYKLEKVKRHFSDKEASFDYYELTAICTICGEELYSDELTERNRAEFEKSYREAGELISNDEITSILDKYRISKRNLPYVLGIGEQTITRYLDGYVPSKKISDLLKKIMNSPEEYAKLLSENKNKLKKSVYVKTKNQVDEILNINTNDTFIEDVAEYIIENNEQTTNLVLQKLLYYVEIFYMAFHQDKLFESQCRAWDHGPVYGRIYYEYNDFKNEPIEKEKSGMKSSVTPELKTIIDCVIAGFGCYSGKVLSYFTHNEDPWLMARASKCDVIDKNMMLEFAKKIKNEYKINEPRDVFFYSEKKFEKYKNAFSKA